MSESLAALRKGTRHDLAELAEQHYKHELVAGSPAAGGASPRLWGKLHRSCNLHPSTTDPSLLFQIPASNKKTVTASKAPPPPSPATLPSAPSSVSVSASPSPSASAAPAPLTSRLSAPSRNRRVWFLPGGGLVWLAPYFPDCVNHDYRGA
jgi:hypothetical protein